MTKSLIGNKSKNSWSKVSLSSSEIDHEFWDTMHKNNAPTIDNLYQVVKSKNGKNKTTNCPSEIELIEGKPEALPPTSAA